MKLPVYLYANLFEVILDLDNNNRINQVMYQRDLKLQKGVKNKVQLQFKNSDQKFLDVSTSSFTFVLFDAINQRNLIEKTVTILDDGTTRALRGLGEVVFTESDLDECESTYYKMGVKALDSTDGSYTPAFANTYYGVGATIEVRHDLYPTLLPSQEVLKDPLEDHYVYNADQNALRYEFYSGNFYASPAFRSGSVYPRCHTAAFYLNNFKGKIIVQGTLDNSPGEYGNAGTAFADIDQLILTSNTTEVKYINWIGAFSYIRFKVIPDTPAIGQNYNPSESNFASRFPNGFIDKILYRS